MPGSIDRASYTLNVKNRFIEIAFIFRGFVVISTAWQPVATIQLQPSTLLPLLRHRDDIVARIDDTIDQACKALQCVRLFITVRVPVIDAFDTDYLMA